MMNNVAHADTHTYIRNFVFFFNDPATTEIYTLSLHYALPIYLIEMRWREGSSLRPLTSYCAQPATRDRKSTRLNSSHMSISYAVFCLKKKRHHRMTYLVRYFQHAYT